jgi:8-oxo-dGTP pyrophosphatase MutT (NUDIX family)
MTGSGGADLSALRIREAARALILDTDDRVLLVRFEFPTGTRWALPGGGLETGETAADALHRELAEEVGLVDVMIGPLIWTRVHVIPFIDGRYDGQREQIHLVRTEPFEPQPHLSWKQLNAEYVHELRWWRPAEIQASSAHFAPAALARHLTALLTSGPPNPPVDVGV